MHKKHLFKLLSAFSGSAIIISTIATTTISCGHKKITPPSKKTWTIFKTAALKVSATTLKKQITNLEIYHWITSDVATFSSNGAPVANEKSQSIIAVIIVKNAKNSDYQLPIQCSITYTKNTLYNVVNWKFTQAPNVANWVTFKAVALKVTLVDLLKTAKISKTYSSFRWEGNPNQQTWQDGQMAEWDTYGGLGGKDPYKGMNGQLVADDATHSVSAIISIVGKEGNYDANPIKVTITDKSNDTYSLKNWTFSAIQQLQSRNKFVSLFNKQVAIVSALPSWSYDDPKNHAIWYQFSGNNWSATNAQNTKDKYHSSTVQNYLNTKGFSSGHGGVWTAVYQNSQVADHSVKNGVEGYITIRGIYLHGNYPIESYAVMKLTMDFIYHDNNINVGSCFDNTWNMNVQKTIPPIS